MNGGLSHSVKSRSTQYEGSATASVWLAGVVEGFHNKAKLTMRKAYGFKEYTSIEIALYHQLGKLPEPKCTHRFC